MASSNPIIGLIVLCYTYCVIATSLSGFVFDSNASTVATHTHELVGKCLEIQTSGRDSYSYLIGLSWVIGGVPVSILSVEPWLP